MISQQDREILRARVAGYLATRHPLEFEAAAICRSIASRQIVDFAITPADVEQALAFLEGLSLVSKHHTELGATIYWAATSQGVLESERKGWCV